MGNLINDATLLAPASTPSLEPSYMGRRFIVGADASLAALPGLVFGNGGQSRYTALASIAAAYSKAVTNRGDTIFCAQTHIEPALVAAGSLAIAKTDLTIMGVPGTRLAKPTIKYSTLTTASLLITAARTKLKNLFFNLTGIDALANPLNIQAADCIIEDCDFLLSKSAATAAQAVLALLTSAAADRLIIRRCRFLAEAGDTNAGSTAAIALVGGSDALIEDCWIDGYFTTTVGGIYSVTTASKRTRLLRNNINNRTAAATRAMSWVAASTPELETGNICHLGNGTTGGGNIGLGTAASGAEPAFGIGPSGLTTGRVGHLNYWSNVDAVTPTIY